MINTNRNSKSEIANRLPKLIINDKSQQGALVALLKFHGLIPFFFEYYEFSNHENELKELLRKHYLQITAENLKIQAIQDELEKYFVTNGIDFLFLKGLNLSLLLYGKTNIRPLLDIDILIRPHDHVKIYTYLIQNGASEKRFLQNKFLQQFTPHEVPLFYKNVFIELHTRMFTSNNMHNQQMFNPWDNLKSISTGTKEITFLTESFYLLYLCIHAHRHLTSGKLKMLWYVDIAVFLSGSLNQSKQYTDLDMLATSCGQFPALASTFYLINKYILPDRHLEKYHIENKNLEEKFTFLICNMNLHVGNNYYRTIFRELTFLNKIRYAAGILVPNINYMKEKFSTKNYFYIFFLYLANPFRIFFKAIKNNFKLF